MGARNAQSATPGQQTANDASPRFRVASHRGRRHAWRALGTVPARRVALESGGQHCDASRPCCDAALPALSRLRVVMLPATSHAAAQPSPGLTSVLSASSRRLTHARAPRETGLPSAGPSAQASGIGAEW
jgi:hypothetical protein